MKLSLIIGNRPHFIKCAPLLRALKQHPEIDVSIIHSGQHYDTSMSGVFLKDFEFPPLDRNLNVGSGTCSVQTGTILARLDPVLEELAPDRVVTMGDTNTTLAGALAAYYRHIPNAHIEAGMRESIWRPEEINKKIADHCADYLFAPMARAVQNLVKEGIPQDRIFLTGDITLDTFLINRDTAVQRMPLLQERYGLVSEFDLVTLHRAETVDDPVRLKGVMDAFVQWPRPLVFPVHPRTMHRLQEFGYVSPYVNNPNLIHLPPLSYMDFLTLLLNASIVATDSSGVLKEAFYAKKFCLVIDDTSEYREIFDLGAAVFGGRTTHSIMTQLHELENREFPDVEINPFGDGRAAERMISVLKTPLCQS